jgi:hypothetical protein
VGESVRLQERTRVALRFMKREDEAATIRRQQHKGVCDFTRFISRLMVAEGLIHLPLLFDARSNLPRDTQSLETFRVFQIRLGHRGHFLVINRHERIGCSFSSCFYWPPPKASPRFHSATLPWRQDLPPTNHIRRSSPSQNDRACGFKVELVASEPQIVKPHRAGLR